MKEQESLNFQPAEQALFFRFFQASNGKREASEGAPRPLRAKRSLEKLSVRGYYSLPFEDRVGGFHLPVSGNLGKNV